MANNPLMVGVFIIVQNNFGNFLLGQRKNCYKAGHFGFPGGRVELEESLIDAAKRELYEETGLVAENISYVGVIRETQADSIFIHFAYVCHTLTGEPKLMESDKCAG